MTTRMNTLFFLSKKKTNKKGRAPIYCRITINGQRSEFSTGISVKENEWRNDSVTSEHPQANVFNAKIRGIKTRLLSVQLSLSLSGDSMNSETIKNKYFEKAVTPKTFVQVMAEIVERVDKNTNVATNTKNTYLIRQKNILSFLKHEKKASILCTEITIDLCQRFETYYRNKKFTFNYINKHIYFFGQVIKQAMRDNILNYNPLANYQYTKDEEKPIVSLSADELSLMENYKFASAKLQYIADLYITKRNRI